MQNEIDRDSGKKRRRGLIPYSATESESKLQHDPSPLPTPQLPTGLTSMGATPIMQLTWKQQAEERGCMNLQTSSRNTSSLNPHRISRTCPCLSHLSTDREIFARQLASSNPHTSNRLTLTDRIDNVGIKARQTLGRQRSKDSQGPRCGAHRQQKYF